MDRLRTSTDEKSTDQARTTEQTHIADQARKIKFGKTHRGYCLPKYAQCGKTSGQFILGCLRH